MATTNPIVNTLPDYVEQNRMPLLVKAIMGAKSAKLFTLQTDVKGPTAINLLETDVEFNAASCGWNESGSTEHTQRVIDAKYLEVNMGYCDKKLFGKWAQNQISIAANPKAMPFEEEFTNSVADGIAAQIEKLMWQGDGSNAGEFDGVIKILNAVDDLKTVEAAKGTAAYEVIKDVYMALPAEVAEKEDAVIFVSDGLFRQFIQELVSANLYHYEPSDVAGEYKLPGTNVRVISVNGLNGTATYDYVVGGRLGNFFYGTDMVNDAETLDLWYSKDEREFRLASEFVGGVQVAFPDQIVMGKLEK